VIQVAFVNRKGGAGKTTVATLATLGLLDSGFTVGVKDYDDQGSFRTSLFGSGVKEDPALLPDCDVVVADTPGRFGTGFDEAVQESHLVVIVSGVQPLEITELPRTYGRVGELRAAAARISLSLPKTSVEGQYRQHRSLFLIRKRTDAFRPFYGKNSRAESYVTFWSVMFTLARCAWLVSLGPASREF
jgi:cellulose biosynthesis protein BcsQ